MVALGVYYMDFIMKQPRQNIVFLYATRIILHNISGVGVTLLLEATVEATLHRIGSLRRQQQQHSPNHD